MESHQAIKALVQHTLGCGCPDEVFESIQVDEGAGRNSVRSIRIGGRLLVQILDATRTADLFTAVRRALQEGRRERDQRQFNRFRLVVTAPDPDAVRRTAERAFAGDPHRDERTHLHVLDERLVQSR